MPMANQRLFRTLLLILVSTTILLAQPARRPLKLDDLARLREVRDPQISPDGQSVAYVVSTLDVKEDKTNSHIWMIGYDGKSERQMTSSQERSEERRVGKEGKARWWAEDGEKR